MQKYVLLLDKINIWLWLALLPVYALYEYVGTKNTLATANLQAISASNTSILMYLIGVLGTYVCIVDGLTNLIPIIIGAWLGTYWSIKLEIKHKRNGEYRKNREDATHGGQSQTDVESSKRMLRIIQTEEPGLRGFIRRLWGSWHISKDGGQA